MGANENRGRRAIFLDRDGVINRNVLNPATAEYESPLTPDDFEFVPGALSAARELRSAGFLLFLVSNQPNYAKGKCSQGALQAIHEKFVRGLKHAGITFTRFYYCFHHPSGSVPGYSRSCQCRKPSPYFLLRAREEFGLNLRRSWMIGDRRADVECGRAAGTKTVLICGERLWNEIAGDPDSVALDISAAARLILSAE